MADDHPPPFPPQFALVEDVAQHLPGEPRVSLTDGDGVNTFLHRELGTPLLDELYPWYEILAPMSGDNISSLHRQRVKGREIIPSEDPSLHMVWDKNKIYVKPIPACLLSYRVWETFLSGAEPGQHRSEVQPVGPKDLLPPGPTATSTPQLLRPSCNSSPAPANGPRPETSEFLENLPHPLPSFAPTGTNEAPPTPKFDRKAALGFLRSYAYLIRHVSDLNLAREVGLLPELETPITWTRWAFFISHFQSIPDSAVSQRYHFGHLRMGRLDWAVRMRFIHGLFTTPTSLPTTASRVDDDTESNIQTRRTRTETRTTTSKDGIKWPRWYYLQPYWSIPVLLEGMFNYFLFAFATASLLLSAMQVLLAIPPGAYIGFSGLSASVEDSGEVGTILGGRYVLGMWRFCWAFANATIYLCGLLCLGMLGLLAYPYLKKLAKAVLRGIRRRRGGKVK